MKKQAPIIKQWSVDGVLQSRVEVYLGDGPTTREKKGNLYILRNVPPDQNPLNRSGEIGAANSSKRPGLNLFNLNCDPAEDPHRAMALFSWSVEQAATPETEILEWIAGIFDKFRESKNSSKSYTLDVLFGVAGKKRIKDIVYERRDKLISHDFFLLKKMFGLINTDTVSMILAKAETGFYYKNNWDNVTVELLQESVKEKKLDPFGEGRQIQTIASKYLEYWENRYFISPKSFPTRQKFLATFPQTEREYILTENSIS